MKRFFLFFFALASLAAFVGCGARFVNSYTFNAPTFGQQTWNRDYPKGADTATVKCLYTNTQTGATIRVIEDSYAKPDIVRSAQAMQRTYRECGYDVGEVLLCGTGDGKYAGFTYARGKDRGKVVAVRRPNAPKTFLLIGEWTRADDVPNSADIERLAQEFEVEAERVPVE